MNTKICTGMTKKDLFNAQSASRTIPEAIDEGLVFEITGVAVIENGATSKNGQPCDVGYIATKNDGVFGFTSNVILNKLDMLSEMIGEEPIEGRFKAGNTKDGTQYYTIELV